MSRHLPQDLRTKKTNSLPDDLKSIAEELIGEKFGFEEEVVERKASDPFPPSGFGFDETTTISEPHHRLRGYRNIEVLDDFMRFRGYVARARISNPTFRCLVDEGLRVFDRENIRHDRVIFVGRYFLHEMMRREPDFRFNFRENMRARQMGEHRTVGEIFGCKVVIIDEDNKCYLQARI